MLYHLLFSIIIVFSFSDLVASIILLSYIIYISDFMLAFIFFIFKYHLFYALLSFIFNYYRIIIFASDCLLSLHCRILFTYLILCWHSCSIFKKINYFTLYYLPDWTVMFKILFKGKHGKKLKYCLVK